MRRKSQVYGLSTIFSLLIGLFLCTGCSDSSNQADSSFAATAATAPSMRPMDAGDFRPEIAITNVEAAAQTVLANTGGAVTIPVGGGYSAILDVPANAIPKDTLISAFARVQIQRNQTNMEFSFEPDGLQFSIAATLTIEARAFKQANLKYVDWYYFNPEKNAWEYIERYYVEKGQIAIPIPHFSKWLAISQGGQ